MATVIIKDLCKSYGDAPVLSHVDLDVPDGSLTVLLGPSGSGKTTLLHIVAGILQEDSGEILFDGERMNDVPVHQRNAVLVDQSVTLFPHMTVEQNIAFGLDVRKQKKDVVKAKVAELLELVELSGFEKRRPSELSGGQMQRVALARALAVEPRVLLLDEPFSKLDITLRESMRVFVRSLQQKMGITTIMVTHDAAEALSMADRVAVLLDHEICQTGTPEEVYERPVSKLVSEFFGVRNFVTRDGVTYLIRPEEIRIAGRKTDISAEGNVEHVPGTVRNRVYTGDRIQYTVDTEAETLTCLTLGRESFRPGDEVILCLDFDHAIRLED